ncbi:MAG: phosphoribosyltransferase family protein [Bacillota bacterium]
MITGYYDEHSEVIQLSWDDVMDMCRELATAIKSEFDPDVVVGIAKGGVIPAVIIASMLRVDFFPARFSRRQRDMVVREKPEVLVPLTDDVRNRRVLIVDSVSATGETLRLAVGEAKKKGARKVKTAALYVHPTSWRPTWYALESDALVIEPWDFEVLNQGKFVMHPEYEAALERIERG